MNPPDPELEVLLLKQLIDVFERLGINVEFASLSFEDIKGKGGLCRVHERRKIILERSLTTPEMCELLASELAQMDIEGLYLSPVVREAVERYVKRNV